jgi:hypothetical protein
VLVSQACHSIARRITEAAETITENTEQIMRQTIRYRSLAVVLAGALIASWALAAEKDSTPKLDPKQVEEACTPGPAHKALDPLVGEWNAEVKMWMEPGAAPTITKGSAKSTWTLGDRYVQTEFSGEFMGKPFRGISFTGYDNVRKQYRSVWLDDMATSMVISEGGADVGGKVITLGGDYACAMTGEKHKQTKQIFRIISRDKHVFEMHDPKQTGNSKTMEITYTRK